MRKRTMFDVDALFRARNQFWVRATYRDVPTEAANVIRTLNCAAVGGGNVPIRREIGYA